MFGQGLNFEVQVSAFEENLNKEELSPSEYVTATASGKAHAVYTKIKDSINRPTLIISADSVVVSPVKPERPNHDW